MRVTRKRQSGNILFLILLAVVLFAALAYAVTNSMRGGGRDAAQESADVTAAEILNYVNAVRNAVMRLQLNGCHDDQISFTNSVYQFVNNGVLNQTAPATPAGNKCEVFLPEGGGITPVVQARNVLPDSSGCTSPTNNMKPGHYIFRYGPLPNVGTGAKELVMSVGGIKNEVCRKLNEKLIGQAFIPISDQGFTPVATANGLNTALVTSTTEDPAVYGQMDFCFGRSTAVNGCTVGVGYEGQFVATLIAR